MTNKAKARVQTRLREMLDGIGIQGEYTITPQGLDAPVFFTFDFEDPKDQFIFELHGGDARYSKIVVGIAKEYLDSYGNLTSV